MESRHSELTSNGSPSLPTTQRSLRRNITVGKFSKRPSLQDPIESVPAMPSHCQKQGCENEAKIFLCEVRAGASRRVGAFSEFGKKQRFADGSSSLSMRNNFQFDRWVARCSICYTRELYRAGKGGLQSLVGHAPNEKKPLLSTLADLMKR